MRKKLKWIFIGLLVLVVVTALGGFIYFKYFFTIDIDLFKPGPTTEVNLVGWQKLEKGMTKPQVIALLGDAPSKTGPGRSVLGGITNTTPEVWVYNWIMGLVSFGQVHPKAYVVYFDEDGKLDSWREPLETKAIEEAESRTTGRTVPPEAAASGVQ